MTKQDFKEFFERHGEYGITANYYESEKWISIEELYQHFKARLLAELSEKQKD